VALEGEAEAFRRARRAALAIAKVSWVPTYWEVLPKRLGERENGVMRRIWFGLSVVALPVALLATAFGLWLLATPDYDGGRQAVGGLALAVGIPLLIFAAAGLLLGERYRPH
jgi:hypothetical protein